jgi:hypothetical protein
MRPDSTTTTPATRPSVRRRPGRAHRHMARTSAIGATLLCGALVGAFLPGVASAATRVQLGTATPFAVLAGSEVTNVPTSAITGDVGLSPASGSFYDAGVTQAQITGFNYAVDASGPAGSVDNPGLLTQAKNDLTTAFVTAAADLPTTTYVAGDNQLGGQTLTPGVYAFGHAATANLTAASPLTLNGNGDPGSVFVFQASSDLVTASDSVVQLENGAQACNVFWVVGSSATLASGSTFVGTLMALTSATLATGATVQGRILARNGAVTLDANTITVPSTCATTTAASTTTATAPGSTPTTTTPGTVAATTGVTGSGGTAAGATPGVATSAAVVPAGFPHTGGGGAAHGPIAAFVLLGALSLLGSAGLLMQVARRRHGDSPGT